MYTEGEFSVKKFILKAILVVLFVFLLMWLIPMPNLKPVYNRLFVENMETMKQTAKSYYTVERLPKENNQTVKMTLEEMIAMKLLLPIMDSDEKMCDGRLSYVEVMKADTEYILKTNLVCSNNSDYVIEHIGCYDLCEKGCVEEEKVEPTPQEKPKTSKPVVEPIKKPIVKKPTVTLYQLTRTWYKGYINNTSKEQIIYYHEKYGTVSRFEGYEYSCPSGYGDRYGDTCYKYVKEYGLTCTSGTLVGNECKTTTTKVVYSCPTEFHTQVGAGSTMQCYLTKTSDKVACKTGELVNNQCKVPQTTYTYSCPKGDYTQVGSGSTMKCAKKERVGSGSAVSLPVSNSTYTYVSTGGHFEKDCTSCASYYVIDYVIYKTVYDSPIKTPTTTYTYEKPILETVSVKEYAKPISSTITYSTYEPAKYSSYTNVYKKDVIKTPVYSYYTAVTDTKWTTNPYEYGYKLVTSKVVPGDTKRIYTPDWVLTLPAGYVQTETKAEYKWSNVKSESGWTYTGVSTTVQQ